MVRDSTVLFICALSAGLVWSVDEAAFMVISPRARRRSRQPLSSSLSFSGVPPYSTREAKRSVLIGGFDVIVVVIL